MQAQSLEPGREVWTVDVAHSLLDFTVRLVGFNRVRGSITRYTADIAYDSLRPELSSVAFNAEIASLTTGNRERDTHLQTADFFDAVRFPYINFRSTAVRRSGDTLLVTGDLTIRDSTRAVVLPVFVTSPRAQDPFGNQRMSFAAAITINRRDFGIPGPRFWGQAISDSVSIEMEIAGRVWNFATLNWGPASRQSMGQLLYNAADSNRLAAALAQVRAMRARMGTDSTVNFSWWEFTKAAMRLSQRERFAEAIPILDLALELHTGSAADVRAELLARRGEVRLRAGRRADAIMDLRQALALVPSNTNALEWLRFAEFPR